VFNLKKFPVRASAIPTKKEEISLEDLLIQAGRGLA
jgi:hypothetical protein